MKGHAVATAIAVIGIVLLLAFLVTRSKTIGLAAVEAVEATHAPKIREAQAALNQAKGQLDARVSDVQALKADIAKRRAEIESTHKLVGLSAEERKARYEKLKI